MIKPITRDYFYKLVPEDTKYIKKPVYIGELDKDKYRTGTTKDCAFASLELPLFFEKPDSGVFVYLDSLKIILIPEVYKDIEIFENEDVDFSDWRLEQVSTSPNKKYTLNCLEYTSTYDDLTYYGADLISGITDGDYVIKNSRIGISEPITIRETKSWCVRIYLGFPEKLVQPYDMKIIAKKDKELRNMLLWTQK